MDQLKQAVAAAFDNVVASGAIEAAIEKRMAETITEAVSEQFRSYGEFGKAIKEKVKQACGVNLDRMDLPSYNDLIIKIIHAQLDGVMQGDAAKQLESNMAKLLAPAPAEITLEQLIKDFIESNTEDHEGKEFTLVIERETWGSIYVCFDVEPNKRKYECDFRLGVDTEGKVYHFALGGKDVAKTMFVGPLYGFERTIFQLYAAKSKLIIPADATSNDFETYFPDPSDN